MFGNIGDGDLHTGMIIDVRDDAQRKKVHAARDEIHNAVLYPGGTPSAELGIGVIRSGHNPGMHGRGYEVMKAIKRVLDPRNVMNPGKMEL